MINAKQALLLRLLIAPHHQVCCVKNDDICLSIREVVAQEIRDQTLVGKFTLSRTGNDWPILTHLHDLGAIAYTANVVEAAIIRKQFRPKLGYGL